MIAALRGRGWLILAVALAAGWIWTAMQLADVRLTLANERTVRVQDLADADRARAAVELANAQRLTVATETFANRLAAIDPIVLRSTDTVREYEKTDAGRVLCRSPDRVRAVDALDAELAQAARSPGGGADTVRSDAAAPAAGR